MAAAAAVPPRRTRHGLLVIHIYKNIYICKCTIDSQRLFQEGADFLTPSRSWKACEHTLLLGVGVVLARGWVTQ